MAAGGVVAQVLQRLRYRQKMQVWQLFCNGQGLIITP
jgi:hypothetical protein